MPYTSGDILVRAVMEADTGLPKDRIINDFAFQADGAWTDADITAMFGAVDGFYRDVQAGGDSVGEFISRRVNRSATHTLAAYKIQTGNLGSPLREDAWLGPVAPNTESGLPVEVAGVLSFHSLLTGVLEEVADTRPKARRRGRVYIGPLTTTAVTISEVPYYLNSAFLTALRQAAVALHDEAVAANVPWSVWSRADAQLRHVVGGWTDDAPDTQRRRGISSLNRVVWTG